MTDSKYFKFGQMFLDTMERVNADFYVYGPDLQDGEIEVIDSRGGKYVKMDKTDFDEKMQLMKFNLILENIDEDDCVFCDFDTFFISDFSHVFDLKFDIGITVRQDMIDAGCSRAYANGGVFFAPKDSLAKGLLKAAVDGIELGYVYELPEYDEIWHTLECGRKPEKTHKRTCLRWWVDQVFLSALVKRVIGKRGKIEVPSTMPVNNCDVLFLPCEQYNKIDAAPDTSANTGSFICHNKNQKGKPING
jgi:hypothetical protein